MLALNKILVARDFSPSAERALSAALWLARHVDAEVHVLYAVVQEGERFGPPPFSRAHDARIREHLRQLPGGLVAASNGLAVEVAVAHDEAAAPAILGYAEEHDIDLIAMGTHGRRGVRHLLLGSVAEEVTRTAPCPVLTVRATVTLPEGEGWIRRMLVPVDFSRHALVALRHARELAVQVGASLRLLHVVEERLHPAFYNTGIFSVYDADPQLNEKAHAHLETFFEEAGGPPVAMHADVVPGLASQEIPRYAAAEDVDLIVMATHGLTGIEHFLLGSVAEKVIRHAPCPVFAVKSFGKSLVTVQEAAAADATA